MLLAATALLSACATDDRPRSAPPTATRGTTPTVTASPTPSRDAVPTLVVTSDRDGDTELYLRTPDGRLEQLTRNTGSDYGAVWSPDGARLAFVSDRDGNEEVYVLELADRSVRQLTRTATTRAGTPVSNRAPAWSPDGTMLAFTSSRDGGEAEVYLMAADGSGPRRLTRTEAYVVDHEPDWSPDGRYVVFSSNRYGDDNTEILRVRADGSGLVRLTETADGVSDNAPQYSPDGTRILFSSTAKGQHDLVTMAADGSDVRPLHGDPGLDDVFPRWSSDGRSVVFQTFGRPGVPNGEDVWVVGADGTGLRRLLSTPASESMPDPRPTT